MKKHSLHHSEPSDNEKPKAALDSFELFYEEMPLKQSVGRSSTRLQRPSRKN